MKYFIFAFGFFTLGYGVAVFQYWINKLQYENKKYKKFYDEHKEKGQRISGPFGEEG